MSTLNKSALISQVVNGYYESRDLSKTFMKVKKWELKKKLK